MEDGVRRDEIVIVRVSRNGRNDYLPHVLNLGRIYNKIGSIPMGADPYQWW